MPLPEDRAELFIPTLVTPEELHRIADGLEPAKTYSVSLGEVALNFPDYPLIIDTNLREAVSGRKLCVPTNIEFGILELLARKAGTRLTRDEIIYEIWGEEFDGNTHVVDVHGSNLKAKLVKKLDIPCPIRTVRSRGFVFDPSPRNK